MEEPVKAGYEVDVETAAFLLEFMNNVQISVGAPDFPQTALKFIKAQEQLMAVLNRQTDRNAPIRLPAQN